MQIYEELGMIYYLQADIEKANRFHLKYPLF